MEKQSKFKPNLNSSVGSEPAHKSQAAISSLRQAQQNGGALGSVQDKEPPRFEVIPVNCEVTGYSGADIDSNSQT